MEKRCSAQFRAVKSFVRRDLYDVESRAVERPVPADPDRDAAFLDDDLYVLDSLGHGLHRHRRRKLWDSVDLGSVKDRECAQYRDAPRLPSAIARLILDLDRLVEIDRRRLLALADLPAARGRLAVAAPARIVGRESERRHSENEEVDAAVAMASGGVQRRRRASGGGLVPRPSPGRCACLERGDDLVGEFLIVVASLRGTAAEVSHCGSSSGTELFLNEPPPSHGGRRGKGAHAARESPAKRLDRANPCGGERLMRDRYLFSPYFPFSSGKGGAQNRRVVIRSRPFLEGHGSARTDRS